jgi:hypothetical protein
MVLMLVMYSKEKLRLLHKLLVEQWQIWQDK